MKIEAKTLINRVQSKLYRAHRSSLALSFERFPLSAMTYPQIEKQSNLLGSTATVGIKLTSNDKVEIIHIETRVTDIDMKHIVSTDGEDDDYIYNIKLKDTVIHTGDRYKSDDILGQVVYVKLLLKSNNKEKDDQND